MKLNRKVEKGKRNGKMAHESKSKAIFKYEFPLKVNIFVLHTVGFLSSDRICIFVRSKQRIFRAKSAKNETRKWKGAKDVSAVDLRAQLYFGLDRNVFIKGGVGVFLLLLLSQPN